MADPVVTVHVKVGDVEIFGEYDDGTIFPVDPGERDAIRAALENALRMVNSPLMDEVAPASEIYRLPAGPAELKSRSRVKLTVVK
jgi:hypothetical protein